MVNEQILTDEQIMTDKQLSHDFMHLAAAMNFNENDGIYELVAILENALQHASYKESAKENLVTYAHGNLKLKGALDYIADSELDAFKTLKPLVDEILSELDALQLKPFKG